LGKPAAVLGAVCPPKAGSLPKAPFGFCLPKSSPFFANLVFANLVFANLVFANLVFANPGVCLVSCGPCHLAGSETHLHSTSSFRRLAALQALKALHAVRL
jgi:hypothetical protein